MNPQQARSTCSAALAALLCAAPCLAADLVPLLGCRTLADSAARLACFDRESAALDKGAATLAAKLTAMPAAMAPTAGATAAPAPAGSVAATPPVAVLSPPPAARPFESKENFGLPESAIAQQEVAAGLRTAELKQVDAHIAAVSVSAGGQATFTLDNGQVWREVVSEGDLLAKPGDVVTISRGALRSYSLRLKSGRSSKVTRLR